MTQWRTHKTQPVSSRLDRVVRCKLKNTWKAYLNAGSCLSLGIKHMWMENGKNFENTTYYDMDLVKSPGARQVWLLRNESNYYALSAQDRRSQVQPITQVCLDDSVLMTLPLFSANGRFLDPTSQTW